MAGVDERPAVRRAGPLAGWTRAAPAPVGRPGEAVGSMARSTPRTGRMPADMQAFANFTAP